MYPSQIWLVWCLNLLTTWEALQQDGLVLSKLANRYIQLSKAGSDGGKNNVVYVWCVT